MIPPEHPSTTPPADSQSNVEIRRAHAHDTPALASLLRTIGLFPRIEGEPEEGTLRNVSRCLATYDAGDSHSIYVVVASDGSLIGYIAVHWLPYLILSGPEGFISELFIRQEHRGHGLGTRLLQVVEQEAASRGCSRLQLINFRDRESYERGFYTKAGWEERPDGASFVRRL